MTPDRLLAAGTEAEAGNWLMVHKTYDSNRFSTLNEINASNVAGLRVITAAAIGGTEPAGFGVGSIETTPLADNGFLYVSDPWGTPYKFDVSDGKSAKLVWICDTGIDKDPSRGVLLANRGLALSGNNVITVLNDGRVVACDSETGDVVWDQQVGQESGEGFTNAPLVDRRQDPRRPVLWRLGDARLDRGAEGRDRRRAVALLHGAGAGPAGVGNLEVRRGRQPRLLEDRRRRGIWVTGSYDPATNTTYWGTGNPVPMYDPEYPPGRQPLHQLDRGAGCRYRRAEVVLPVHARRLHGL